MKKIYLVGGAVRDMLMNQTIRDKDYVAVGYTPKDFAHLSRVGKDFPVFLQEDGSELALARVEKKVAQGYNGFEAHTHNVTLYEDLSRRDLTINSIAYDEEQEVFIDPFGGKEDIQKKVLKHTSEAFVEDPLRVLRLARFRARFGSQWQIHKDTCKLVKSMTDELQILQPDRIWKEIQKVLESHNSALFFQTLHEIHALRSVFPMIYSLTQCHQVSQKHREKSLFEHTMMVLHNLDKESIVLKLTALYHDIAKPYCYQTYGSGAGHDNVALVKNHLDIQIPTKLQKEVLFLIKNHSKVGKINTMKVSDIAHFMEQFKKNSELFEKLMRFYEADCAGRISDEPKPALPKTKLRELLKDIAHYSPKEWIDAQPKLPSGEDIARHIHKHNIASVQKILKNRP